jgi:hypothetical protein
LGASLIFTARWSSPRSEAAESWVGSRTWMPASHSDLMSQQRASIGRADSWVCDPATNRRRHPPARGAGEKHCRSASMTAALQGGTRRACAGRPVNSAPAEGQYGGAAVAAGSRRVRPATRITIFLRRSREDFSSRVRALTFGVHERRIGRPPSRPGRPQSPR